MRVRIVVPLLSLLGLLAACGDGRSAAASGSVDASLLAPATWETEWAPHELDTWREGVLFAWGDPSSDRPKEGVPGAKIELLAPRPDGRPPLRVLAETTTGEEGRFRVGPGPATRWLIRATKEGWAPSVGGRGVLVPGPVELEVSGPVRLGFRPAFPLQGRILDPRGNPVPGAKLVAHSLAYRSEVTADASGRFATFAPPAPILVEGLPPFRVPVPARLVVPREGADVLSVEVRGWRDEPLRGRVVTAEDDRRPIAGALVGDPEDPAVWARADGDGRFELSPRPPRFVAALADGRGWRSYPVPVAGDVEMRLHPARVVAGTVLDAAGRPIAGARVLGVVTSWAGFSERVLGPLTGADGRFRFSWLPEAPRGVAQTPRVLAHRRGAGHSPVAVLSSAPAAGESDLELRLGGERELRGRVRRADGEPIAGAHVEVTWDTANIAAQELSLASASDLLVTTTGPDGRFRMTGVPLGTGARLRFTALGVTHDREVDAIAPGSDGAAEVDFALPAGGVIAGRVERSAGGPPGAQTVITARLLDHPELDVVREVAAADDGSFRFIDLPRGTYQLVADAFGFDLPGGRSADVGETDVRLVVERSAVLRFRFVSAEGEPLSPDVPVTVTVGPSDGPGGLTRRVTVPPGAPPDEVPAMAGVVPGEWTLTAEGDVWRGSIPRLVVGDGDDRTIDVVLVRTLRLDGRLLGPAGEPMGGERLVAGSIPPGSGPQTTVTRADGSFSLTGLAPGAWEIRSEPRLRPPLRHRVEIASAANPPVDLRIAPHGSLVVEVTMPDGSPAKDAVVILTDSAGAAVDAWGEQALQLANRFRTDAAGRARVLGVRAGPVHVEAQSAATVLGRVDLDVAADEERRVVIR